MILTFQVIYRLPAMDSAKAIHVDAETREEAEAAIRAAFANDKTLIVHVGPGRNPQMDLLRLERIGATPQEQAYLMSIDPDTLTKVKRNGGLPRPESGNIGRLPLGVLEKANLKQFGLKTWEDAA